MVVTVPLSREGKTYLLAASLSVLADTFTSLLKQIRAAKKPFYCAFLIQEKVLPATRKRDKSMENIFSGLIADLIASIITYDNQVYSKLIYLIYFETNRANQNLGYSCVRHFSNFPFLLILLLWWSVLSLMCCLYFHLALLWYTPYRGSLGYNRIIGEPIKRIFLI